MGAGSGALLLGRSWALSADTLIDHQRRKVRSTHHL